MIFAAFTVVLVVHAYRLQIHDAEVLKKRAEKQRTRVLHVEARRGMIMDRSGEQMAASLEVNSVYAKPRRIENNKGTARTLAEILEMDEREILRKLTEEKTFVWIRRHVSPLVTEKIKGAELPGVLDGNRISAVLPTEEFRGTRPGFRGNRFKWSGGAGTLLRQRPEVRLDPCYRPEGCPGETGHVRCSGSGPQKA